MFEFTQLRIAVRRQHFTVGIDIDAGAWFVAADCEIFQVVARDQDALAFGRFDVDPGVGVGWPY